MVDSDGPHWSVRMTLKYPMDPVVVKERLARHNVMYQKWQGRVFCYRHDDRERPIVDVWVEEADGFVEVMNIALQRVEQALFVTGDGINSGHIERLYNSEKFDAYKQEIGWVDVT